MSASRAAWREGLPYGRAPFLLAGDVRGLERLELELLEEGLVSAILAALSARLAEGEHLRSEGGTWGRLWAQLDRLELELERRRPAHW